MSRIVEALDRLAEANNYKPGKPYDNPEFVKRLKYLSDKFDLDSIYILKALNYQYGLDRDQNLDSYSDEEVERAIDYYFEKGIDADWV